MNKLLLAILLASSITIIGCSNSKLNKNFDLSSVIKLQESSSEIFESLSPDQQQVAEWAVNTLGLSNIESLAKLKEVYGENISYSDCIRQAIKKRKETVFSDVDRLTNIQKEWNDIFNDLSKIKASNISIGNSSEFFTNGDAVVSFDVFNGSSKKISSIRWDLSLYLNDDKEAYATYTGTDSYIKSDQLLGLKPGETQRKSIVIDTFGFNEGPKKWIDANVKNATKKRILVKVIPTSVEDMDKEEFITGDVNTALKKLNEEKSIIINAEKMVN